MPQRRQLWGTGARTSWSLRMFTNLAIYVYIYLQWAVMDRLWTTHIFTFQQQIHRRLTLHSAKGNYSAALNNMMLIHWPLMDRLLHLVQRGGDWPIRSRPGPSSLYQM